MNKVFIYLLLFCIGVIFTIHGNAETPGSNCVETTIYRGSPGEPIKPARFVAPIGDDSGVISALYPQWNSIYMNMGTKNWNNTYGWLEYRYPYDYDSSGYTYFQSDNCSMYTTYEERPEDIVTTLSSSNPTITGPGSYSIIESYDDAPKWGDDSPLSNQTVLTVCFWTTQYQCTAGSSITPGVITKGGQSFDNGTIFIAMSSNPMSLYEILSTYGIGVGAGSDTDKKYGFGRNYFTGAITTTCNEDVSDTVDVSTAGTVDVTVPGIYDITFTWYDQATAAFTSKDSNVSKRIYVVVYSVVLNRPVSEYDGNLTLTANTDPSDIFTSTRWTVYASVNGVSPYIVNDNSSITFDVDGPGLYIAQFEGFSNADLHYIGQATCVSWQVNIVNPTIPPLSSDANESNGYTGNEFTFSSDTSKILRVHCVGNVIPLETGATFYWDTFIYGSNGPQWTPSDTVINTIALYTGLPSHVDDFGKKQVFFRNSSPDFSKSIQYDYEIFYSHTANNHPAPFQEYQQFAELTDPGNHQSTLIERDYPNYSAPNWFYYYIQIHEPEGDVVRYTGQNLQHGAVTVLMTDGKIRQLFTPNASPANATVFAALVNHENDHASMYRYWWPSGYNSVNDSDGDFAPDWWEQNNYSKVTIFGRTYHPVDDSGDDPTIINTLIFDSNPSVNNSAFLPGGAYLETRGAHAQGEYSEISQKNHDWSNIGLNKGRE